MQERVLIKLPPKASVAGGPRCFLQGSSDRTDCLGASNYLGQYSVHTVGTPYCTLVRSDQIKMNLDQSECRSNVLDHQRTGWRRSAYDIWPLVQAPLTSLNDGARLRRQRRCMDPFAQTVQRLTSFRPMCCKSTGRGSDKDPVHPWQPSSMELQFRQTR